MLSVMHIDRKIGFRDDVDTIMESGSVIDG
jgi:hypothetical protein